MSFSIIGKYIKQESSPMEKPIKLRWLVAHEPIHLFLRTAKAFKAAVEKITDNRVEVEILEAHEYKAKYDPNSAADFTQFDPCLNMVMDGKVEMIQGQTVNYSHYDKNFLVLDMPYLFESHEHCTRVLEGSIGTSLRKSITNKTDVAGLAFTYSGGYRAIGTKGTITNFADLEGLEILVGPNPVITDTFKAVGAKPKVAVKTSADFDRLTADADAVNTTYLRFVGNEITRTNHSMYLTMIAINKKFLESLPLDLQIKIEEAALEASRIERDWAIKDAEDFEKNCSDNGIKINFMPEEEINKFKAAVDTVYDKYQSWWSHPDLPQKIKQS
jgi:TRAP-type C4-dicarboxylate transport system substrate-binding protein